MRSLELLAATGIVLPFALATPPAGWLLCNGAVLTAGAADHLRAQLIAAGSPYGVSGSDPKLPDMRGEFPRGVDAGRGVDTGRTLGSAQKGTIIPIDGTGDNQPYVAAFTSSPGPSSLDVPLVAARTGVDVGDAGDYPNTSPIYVNGGGAGGFSHGVARPRNLALNFIIKT